MTRWSSRRLFGLVLALFVSVGLALSGAHAGQMGGKMMMSGADHSMSGSCGGCDNDNDKAPNGCKALCVGAVPALVPVGSAVLALEPADFQALAPIVRVGQARPPDPFPPRPSMIV